MPQRRTGTVDRETATEPLSTSARAEDTRARLAWRTRAAIHVGRAAARASRLLGYQGRMIGGRISLLLRPGCLAELARDRRVLLVSGTNGKTTTTAMLATALATTEPVASNSSGANMLDGLTSALTEQTAATLAGEVDELYLPAAVTQTRPAALVLLNLSRDQLDRAGELRHTAAQLRALARDFPELLVVANCDDPYVVFVACAFARVRWVAAGTSSHDAGSCPQCGHRLTSPVPRDPRWGCERCGLHRPDPEWSLSDAGVITPDGTPLALNLRIPGAVNRSNAVMAVAASDAFGIDPRHAAGAVATVEGPAGRYRAVRYGQYEVRLLLAKNPAGWSAMLGMLCSSQHPVVIAVNGREADGRDTSWLYDVAFERLAAHHVIVAGDRAGDVGTRLSYAGVPHTTTRTPLAALDQLQPGPVFVVGDYTSFLDLRRRLDTAGEHDHGVSAGAASAH